MGLQINFRIVLKEGNVLFNDTQHILFYGYMVSDR